MNFGAFGERLGNAEAIFIAVEKLLEIPLFQFQQASSSNKKFIEVLENISFVAQKHNRSCLQIAGGYLDEYVTTSALAALAYGIDV